MASVGSNGPRTGGDAPTDPRSLGGSTSSPKPRKSGVFGRNRSRNSGRLKRGRKKTNQKSGGDALSTSASPSLGTSPSLPMTHSAPVSTGASVLMSSEDKANAERERERIEEMLYAHKQKKSTLKVQSTIALRQLKDLNALLESANDAEERERLEQRQQELKVEITKVDAEYRKTNELVKSYKTKLSSIKSRFFGGRKKKHSRRGSSSTSSPLPPSTDSSLPLSTSLVPSSQPANDDGDGASALRGLFHGQRSSTSYVGFSGKASLPPTGPPTPGLCLTCGATSSPKWYTHPDGRALSWCRSCYSDALRKTTRRGPFACTPIAQHPGIDSRARGETVYSPLGDERVVGEPPEARKEERDLPQAPEDSIRSLAEGLRGIGSDGIKAFIAVTGEDPEGAEVSSLDLTSLARALSSIDAGTLKELVTRHGVPLSETHFQRLSTYSSAVSQVAERGDSNGSNNHVDDREHSNLNAALKAMSLSGDTAGGIALYSMGSRRYKPQAPREHVLDVSQTFKANRPSPPTEGGPPSVPSSPQIHLPSADALRSLEDAGGAVGHEVEEHDGDGDDDDGYEGSYELMNFDKDEEVEEEDDCSIAGDDDVVGDGAPSAAAPSPPTETPHHANTQQQAGRGLGRGAPHGSGGFASVGGRGGGTLRGDGAQRRGRGRARGMAPARAMMRGGARMHPARRGRALPNPPSGPNSPVGTKEDRAMGSGVKWGTIQDAGSGPQHKSPTMNGRSSRMARESIKASSANMLRMQQQLEALGALRGAASLGGGHAGGSSPKVCRGEDEARPPALPPRSSPSSSSSSSSLPKPASPQPTGPMDPSRGGAQSSPTSSSTSRKMDGAEGDVDEALLMRHTPLPMADAPIGFTEGFTVDGLKTMAVTSGTPAALVSHMMASVYPAGFDMREYERGFFRAAELFLEPFDILGELISLYEASGGSTWRRERVASILDVWIRASPQHFEEERLGRRLDKFVKEASKASAKSSPKEIEGFWKVKFHLEHIISAQRTIAEIYTHRTGELAGLGTSLLQPAWIQFEWPTLAQQVCVQHHAVLRDIQCRTELKGEVWNKRPADAPNVVALIQHFNNISFWLQSIIVCVSEVKARANMIGDILEFGRALLRFNNFHGVMAVLAALNSAGVQRLKKTWKELRSSKWRLFDHLSEVFDPSDNKQRYREALREAKPPGVPYLGVVLNDLTIFSEVADTLHGKDAGGNPIMVVNYAKMYSVGIMLATLTRFQREPYQAWKPRPELQNYFDKPLKVDDGDANVEEPGKDLAMFNRMVFFSEDVIYKKSLKLEPRA